MKEEQSGKPKILELYAGSRSIGKAGEKLGYEVCSVDINPFEKIDIVKDVEFLTLDDLPWIPDVGWGSPPCTTYSQAAISHHRPTGKPISEFAEKSDRLVKSTLELFRQIKERNPNFIWYLENPRASLRKMPFMRNIQKTTVCYCKYGDIAMKPTDIFSNNIYSLLNPNGWEGRPMCYNNNPHCHHERAPRGSKTGTQGKKGNYERSKIPDALCLEILEATLLSLGHATEHQNRS